MPYAENARFPGAGTVAGLSRGRWAQAGDWVGLAGLRKDSDHASPSLAKADQSRPPNRENTGDSVASVRLRIAEEIRPGLPGGQGVAGSNPVIPTVQRYPR